jgi:3-oxoacyl-[acyl-carrier-protein] synthase-3
MTFSKIIGSGSYLPDRILTNQDLEKMLDTTDEWITTRTGIKQRHIIADDQVTSDMAYEASKKALQDANLVAQDIDLIILATTTPDKIFPSTACTLQAKLDIPECPAFDVQAVCSGFIYALSIAEKFIKTGTSTTALVVGADAMSRITDYKDRSNAILWGDGAGAVILTKSNEPGILSTHIHAQGKYEDMLHVPRRHDGQLDTIEMQGNQVFKMAVNTLDAIVDQTLDANQLKKSDIDWLVPHQANIRILDATAKKLSMSMDKVIVTIDKHGNTSAASIPLAFDEGVKAKKIKKGQIVLMEAFGGGFTWGSALIKY